MGLSLTGADAGNYTVNPNADTIADITPAPIILSGTRVYDGTADFDPSTFGNGGEIDTGVGTETLFVSGGLGSVPSQNAGSTQPLTVGSLNLVDGANGGLASNYQFAPSDHTGTITPADLYLFAADDTKTYDGTTHSAGVVTYSGIIGSDDINNLTQSFDSKNAGPRIISVDPGYIINDGNGGNNYVVTQFDAIGQIDRANIVISNEDATKTYDSTLIAPGNPIVVGGTVYPGDNPSGGTYLYTDPNFGIDNKTVVVSNVTVGDGTNNNNYIVTYVPNTNSTIEKAVLAINPDVTKVFDGTANATVNNFGVTGLVGNQTVVVNYTSSQFTDRNAGIDKPVIISGISLSDGNNGGLAQNYLISQGSIISATGNIYKAILNLNAVRDIKNYDGNTISNKTPSVFGLISGDSITNLSQNFDSPQPGIRQLLLNPGFVVNDGNNGNNYNYNVVYAMGEIINAPNNGAGVIDVEIEPKYGYRYKYNSAGQNPLKFNLSELHQVSSIMFIINKGAINSVASSSANLNTGASTIGRPSTSASMSNAQANGECRSKEDMLIIDNMIGCSGKQVSESQDQADSRSITITAPTRPTAY